LTSYAYAAVDASVIKDEMWHSTEGNWTTRGLPTRGLDISRTRQLAH